MVERRKMILCWRLPWIHRRRIVPRLPGPATARILSVLRQNGDQSFSKTQHPSTAPKTVPVQCIIRCRSVFFCFFFLLTQLLSNGWIDFHQVITNRRLCSVIRWWWYHHENRSPKIYGSQNVHCWAKIQTPPFLDFWCAEKRRNSGKT